MEYKKLECYGRLSDKKNAVEFCLVDWGGNVKYDLRRWGLDGTAYKGLTFTEEELEPLLKALTEAIQKPKEFEAKYTLDFPGREAAIYDYFGPISEGPRWSKYVTFIDWGRGATYDVRAWNEGFERCKKGVTLSHEECVKLAAIISRIL